MCGISGKIYSNKGMTVAPELIDSMISIMAHRGPDDHGVYAKNNVGLGHKRLSIIDLDSGKQPISNEDGKIWVVFNGEIYNYRELREDLIKQGHTFKTGTDTEVINHLYEEHGERFVSRLRGMFAIALWDEREELLILARDRVGIKPLYYFQNDHLIIFASEIKSILVDPSIPREISPQMINRFLTYFYLPGTETLFKNINKLAPGHYLIFKNGKCEIKEYWDLIFPSRYRDESFNDLQEELIELLRDSVRSHMISDVPVGFLLSGGLDSTALLSFAIDETDKEISTFTIGFEGEDFADERPYAKLVADKFGTKHYDMTMSAQDFLDFLPKYVWHMEEPVCEPPAIALYYVSKLAKKHVKVLISGEGGDEAFAGYPNYRNNMWIERLKKVLGPFNPLVFKLAYQLGKLSGSIKIKKYAPLLIKPIEEYYYSRTSSPFSPFNNGEIDIYTNDFRKSLNRNYSTLPTEGLFNRVSCANNLNKMLYVDTKTWLPDDLLVKADKITMANSIELRVPLLDHKVLEFAASIPPQYKLHGFNTKHILKKAFSNKVPEEILHRKKTGFPVPYDSWLRNDLKSTIYNLLMDKKSIERGYFNKKGVEKMINQNLLTNSYPKEIFSLVALELWQRIFIEKENII